MQVDINVRGPGRLALALGDMILGKHKKALLFLRPTTTDLYRASLLF